MGAHNDFTLGLSTVKVYVELYSSTTNENSYKNMTLESQNYTGDLNIYKTIRTTAPINGVGRYWRARVNYKLDNKSWVSKETTTIWVGPNGEATIK